MTMVVEIRNLQVDRAALARLRCAVRECLSFTRPPAAAEPLDAPAMFELAAAWLPEPWTPPAAEELAQPCAMCRDQMPERLDIFGRCPECVDGARLTTALVAADGHGRRRRPDPLPVGAHRRGGQVAANPDEYRPILPIRERSGGAGLWTYTETETSR